MDFNDFYLSEAGLSKGAGMNSIDRMRTRFRAKLNADIHKDIDPCSWMPENGGIYADVSKEVFKNMSDELQADASSQNFNCFIINYSNSSFQQFITMIQI